MGLSGQKKEIGAELKSERTEDVEVEDGFLLFYCIYWCAGGKKKRTPIYSLHSICHLFRPVTALQRCSG